MSGRVIPLRTKLLYGIGQAAEGLKTAPFELFLLFYYTQVLGLSGTLVGLAILLAMLVDAVTDPLVGMLSDHLSTRLGRRHPLMYLSVLPFAFSLYMVFTPPADLGATGLFAWLACFSVLARASITFFAVPYFAIGAELTSDYAERTSLVGYRSIFGTLAIGAVIYVAFGVFFNATPEFPNGQLNPAAYSPMAGAFALAAIVVMLTATIGTQDQVKYLHTPPATGRLTLNVAIAQLLKVLQNPSFRAVFLGSVIFFAMRGVALSLGLHMGTYFWELTPKELQMFNLSQIAGMVIAVPFVRPLSRVIEKKGVLLISVLLYLGAAALPPILALAGWFPALDSPSLFPSLVAFNWLTGVAGGLMYVSSHSMLGDVADDHELAVGKRSEGILFGCLFLSIKAASGIGHWLSGMSLDLISFPTERVEPGAIAPEIVWRLGAMYGPLIMLLGLCALAAYSGYRITRDSHAATLRALERNRELRVGGATAPG